MIDVLQTLPFKTSFSALTFLIILNALIIVCLCLPNLFVSIKHHDTSNTIVITILTIMFVVMTYIFMQWAGFNNIGINHLV